MFRDDATKSPLTRLPQRRIHTPPGSHLRPKEGAALVAERGPLRVPPGSPGRRSAAAATPLYKEAL